MAKAPFYVNHSTMNQSGSVFKIKLQNYDYQSLASHVLLLTLTKRLDLIINFSYYYIGKSYFNLSGMVKGPNYHSNLPPRWEEFDKKAKIWGATVQMPRRVGVDMINVFRERYRVAKGLNSLKLSGYSNNATTGYLNLLKLFLTYSAFESLLPVIGVNYTNGRYQTESLMVRYPVKDWINKIQEIDNRIHAKTRFFEKIKNLLTGKYIATEVAKYLNNESCNYFALPAAISNLYSHGKLTPGITHAKKTSEICQIFTGSLFNILDAEFCCFLDIYDKEVNDLWRDLQW